jgi:hypothetical protein
MPIVEMLQRSYRDVIEINKNVTIHLKYTNNEKVHNITKALCNASAV